MSSSRPLSERLGKWVFWLMFTGMHVTFLPMHLTGLMAMPRRVFTYLPGRGQELPNLISSIGTAIMAAGVLIWIIDMIRNFRPFGEERAGGLGDPLPGGYALASLADVVASADDPRWRAAGLGFSVLCVLASAALLVLAARRLRRTDGEGRRFPHRLAALGSGLSLVAIVWQVLPTVIGY